MSFIRVCGALNRWVWRSDIAFVYLRSIKWPPPRLLRCSSLLQTMLQKIPFQVVRLSHLHQQDQQMVQGLEQQLRCPLFFGKTGYQWALNAFPHAHERPLMGRSMDFSKLPHVEHRDYDLIILAASSGCLTYTARKLAEGIPVENIRATATLVSHITGGSGIKLTWWILRGKVCFRSIGRHAC